VGEGFRNPNLGGWPPKPPNLRGRQRPPRPPSWRGWLWAGGSASHWWGSKSIGTGRLGFTGGEAGRRWENEVIKACDRPRSPTAGRLTVILPAQPQNSYSGGLGELGPQVTGVWGDDPQFRVLPSQRISAEQSTQTPQLKLCDRPRSPTAGRLTVSLPAQPKNSYSGGLGELGPQISGVWGDDPQFRVRPSQSISTNPTSRNSSNPNIVSIYTDKNRHLYFP